MLHNMLSRFFAPLAVATLLLSPLAPAGAQTDDVKNTKHNLSAASRLGTFTNLAVTDFGEVCAYCHIPRGGATDAPLWNRAYDTGPYQAYASPTINMTIGAPSGVSLVCLSCHDGTIGIDVITNTPNSFTIGSATNARFNDGSYSTDTG